MVSNLRRFSAGLFGLALSLGVTFSWAQTYFSHKDWEMACDNTGTCRAAGYQISTAINKRASMLVSRAAGASAPISVSIQVLDENNSHMVVAGQLVIGKFRPIKFELSDALVRDQSDFTQSQIAVMLPQMLSASQGILRLGKQQTRAISLEGFKAVMLKMDDVQGRVGTRNAIAAVGDKAEDQVPKAKAIPKFKFDVVASPRNDDDKLLPLIKPFLPMNECRSVNSEFSLVRLSEKKMLLVQAPCIIKNEITTNAYWLVNDAPPFAPERVLPELKLNSYRAGALSGNFWNVEGCSENAYARWDGERFITLTHNKSTLCRGAFGWDMPLAVVQTEYSQALREQTKKKAKRAKKKTSIEPSETNKSD